MYRPPARSSFQVAWLDGYCRRPVIGQAYPGMVPAAGRCVQGVLYLDLPPSAWARLDRNLGGNAHLHSPLYLVVQCASSRSDISSSKSETLH